MTQPYQPQPPSLPPRPQPLAPNQPVPNFPVGIGQLPPMPAASQPSPGQPGSPGDYAFHRLAHTSTSYRWWRPFPVAGIALMVMAALTIGVFMAALVGVPEIKDLTLDRPMPASPGLFLFIFASVAIMLPAILIGQLVGGWRPFGLISSVTGRLRWRWLLLCFGAGVVLFAGLAVITLLQEPVTPPKYDYSPVWIATTVALFLVIPIQCAAEEYVFRGFLMQTIGHWLKHPAWAIILPTPFFVIGHAYGGWAMVDVFLMALLSGYLTWRTGGLEAAIGLHVANNLFGAMASLWVTGSFNATDTGSGPGTLISVGMMILYLIFVEYAAKKGRIATVRTIPGPTMTPVQS